ncbi:MAG: diaminopimelate epimerase [Ignavibacteriaceae bacterium]|nr:MAG: diaminopimelate epimerase [Ignavibacteriaceae bacterium]
MRNFKFFKVNGAGNDFILIDAIREFPGNLSNKDITRICDRRKGVGADGVLILVPSADSLCRVEFFNADGSPGTLCGNGARCVINYLRVQGYSDAGEMEFRFGDKKYTGSFADSGEPVFHMKRPAKLKTKFRIKASDTLIPSHYCDTGSPHVVIEINDVPLDPRRSPATHQDLLSFPVIQLGREIRHHPDFAPGGVNVNFIKIISQNEIAIRTFERGVEDETLACGTGSAAAAVVAFALEKCKPPVKIVTKSGDHLTINFEIINNKLENLRLTGPAEINFHVTVGLE